jgi:hypothetical protein
MAMKRSKAGRKDFRGVAPESWNCIDCGCNTAPGFPTRLEVERAYKAGVLRRDGEMQPFNLCFDEYTEVYSVHSSIWAAAGMSPNGGCLCIGCLEQRLGRQLHPGDFDDDPFNDVLTGTSRLLARRQGA